MRGAALTYCWSLAEARQKRRMSSSPATPRIARVAAVPRANINVSSRSQGGALSLLCTFWYARYYSKVRNTACRDRGTVALFDHCISALEGRLFNHCKELPNINHCKACFYYHCIFRYRPVTGHGIALTVKRTAPGTCPCS